MTTSDFKLLANYVRTQEEDLFAELVHRHLNLVYSTALRHVRSHQLAEEVAQSAFVELANHARVLAQRETNLAGWLYTIAYRSALNVLRRETRLKLRERVAAETFALNVVENDWMVIEPSLEEAMHSLEELDKTVILLRYFENKSLRDVGIELQISEAAAQKRVKRAVARLRNFFISRGKKQFTDRLVASISENAIRAATPGLEGACSSAAIIGTAIMPNSVGVVSAQRIFMSSIQKTYLGSFLVIVIAAALFELFELGPLKGVNESLEARLSQQITIAKQLKEEASDSAKQASSMETQIEQMNLNAAEIHALRSEEAELRNRLAQGSHFSTVRKSDPLLIAATEWLNRVEKLQRYASESFPESQREWAMLTRADWLRAVSENKLESAAAFEKALGKLKAIASRRFSKGVADGILAFKEANANLLPTEVLQLASFVKAPYASFLSEFEIIHLPGKSDSRSGTLNDAALKMQTDWGLVNKSSSTGSLLIPDTPSGHLSVIRAGGCIEDLNLSQQR